MSLQLINRSIDLKKLRDDGYEIEINSSFLLIHSVPYLNSRLQLSYGTLVSELELRGDVTAPPSNHVVHFSGEYPHQKDGSEIPQIRHVAGTRELYDGRFINFSFSNKPLQGYKDYYEKMTRYIEIISAPARSAFQDIDIDARTYKPIKNTEEDSVFQYLDTATSRAGISLSANKLAGQRIGVIGVGGTGAYVLDFVAKTSVQEIHIFDGDKFLQHNAFRSPGAACLTDLESSLFKVTYYRQLYSKIHKNIHAHPEFINESNLQQLQSLDFIFLCLDSGAARKLVSEKLEDFDISFVDVGMGLQLVEDVLIGQMRTTLSTSSNRSAARLHVPKTDADIENEYVTNIQVVELNALNASLAVLKWKKFSGFYQDLEGEHSSIYTLNVNMLTSIGAS